MLISHAHQFIYLKTRKTAGTSVEMAFQPWAAAKPDAEVVEKTHAKISVNGVIGSRLILKPEQKPVDKLWFNHMPAEAVAQKMNPRLWSRYLKFAVVRNPFDRMVSNFHWNQTVRHLQHGNTHKVAPEAADFAQTKEQFRSFVLSDSWFTDQDVVTLSGTWCIDVLLRYEHLRQDMDQLAARLEIDAAKIVLPSTKEGKSLRKGQPLDAYFCPETVDVIRRKLGWMFERGGYPETPREWDDQTAGGGRS